MTAETRIHPNGALTQTDLVAGGVIAAAMMSVCTLVSSGLSLIVTFAVGIVFAYGILVLMHRQGAPLPAAERFLPVYFLALAMQFLHFTEEFATGFAQHFPGLYGGAPYSPAMFVGINMVSYALFVLSALAVFFFSNRGVLMPAMFFVMYGVMGNAIAHPVWSIMADGYFPGLFTSLAYWVLGPWLLYLLLGDRRLTAVLIGVYGLALVTALAIGRSA